MSSVEDKTPSTDRPDLGAIPARPQSPAVIRFLGCDAEMAGINADFFTAGRTPDCDLTLPAAMRGEATILLRFSRGPEGWRVSPSDNLPIFVNQELVRGLTSLRSGDVIRFAPGGAGMQFSIVHQNATPLSSLVARYAPRLLGEQPGTGGRAAAKGNNAAVDGAGPLRYEAGGRDARQPTAPAAQDKASRRIDPAVLVAASILLAGFIAGAAFIYSAPPIGDDATDTHPNAAAQTPPVQQTPVEQTPVEPPPVEPPPTQPPAPEPQPTAPAEPDDDPFSDL